MDPSMSKDDQILEAAMRIVEQDGLRGATTRRIADEAGVNEVTLFRRFGSKERLVLEALRRRSLQGPALPEQPVDPEAELTAWCVALATELWATRGLLRSAVVEAHQQPALCSAAHHRPRQLRLELEAYFERLRAAELATGAWAAGAAARMVMGALFSEIVADAVSTEPHPTDHPPASGGAFSPEAVAARYVPLVLRAIGFRTRGSE
jgi:AcrR family transcriptional regulator